MTTKRSHTEALRIYYERNDLLIPRSSDSKELYAKIIYVIDDQDPNPDSSDGTYSYLCEPNKFYSCIKDLTNDPWIISDFSVIFTPDLNVNSGSTSDKILEINNKINRKYVEESGFLLSVSENQINFSSEKSSTQYPGLFTINLNLLNSNLETLTDNLKININHDFANADPSVGLFISNETNQSSGCGCGCGTCGLDECDGVSSIEIIPIIAIIKNYKLIEFKKCSIIHKINKD